MRVYSKSLTYLRSCIEATDIMFGLTSAD